MTAVKVELLVVPDCPNEQAAAELLRTVLDDVGLTRTRFHTTVIATQEQAEQRGFRGSPTILLNGQDPFDRPAQSPSDQDRAGLALTCRVYPTQAGPAVAPPLAELRQALKGAADRGQPR